VCQYKKIIDRIRNDIEVKNNQLYQNDITPDYG
jgi:hypothetical protein